MGVHRVGRISLLLVLRKEEQQRLLLRVGLSMPVSLSDGDLMTNYVLIAAALVGALLQAYSP